MRQFRTLGSVRGPSVRTVPTATATGPFARHACPQVQHVHADPLAGLWGLQVACRRSVACTDYYA